MCPDRYRTMENDTNQEQVVLRHKPSSGHWVTSLASSPFLFLLELLWAVSPLSYPLTTTSCINVEYCMNVMYACLFGLRFYHLCSEPFS